MALSYSAAEPKTTNQRIDRGEVVRALKLYADGPFEVRIIDAVLAGRNGIASGYFDNPEIAADAIAKVTSWSGVYFTPNPIDSALLARRHNRIALAGKRDAATSDKDIIARRWLLIDADPVRPAGISASDAEHDAALERIRRIADFLAENSWPEGILADSGNGAHLTFPIDLPADDGGLVERVLRALAELFDDHRVKIDTSVHNAARIWKLPGSLARKGDSTADRPHRMARIISAPETPTIVIRDQLEHIAAQAKPKPAASPKPNCAGGSTFDADAFIRRHEPDADGPHDYHGGARKWILPTCAFNSSHTGGSAVVIQLASGAMSFSCRHNSCSGRDWKQYRAIREPGYLRAKLPTGSSRTDDPGETIPDYGDVGGPDTPAMALAIEDAAALVADCPELRPYVIDGLLREREILNFVSASKVGKTWAMMDLALCIATGRAWLGRFSVRRGDVLCIDAELHRQTIAGRLRSIASARGILRDEYAGHLHVLSLRGRLRTITELEPQIRAIAPGRYAAIVIDSLYRVWPAGLDENSNSDVTGVYNTLDRWADMTGAGILAVHHSSKGGQAGKAVTDVGSGAGAQSRAADVHLILRPHEQDDAAVLEAVVRSSPPVEPVGLRWKHPVWFVDESLDVDRLREPGQKAAGNAAMTPEDFAGRYLNGQAIPRNLLMAKARASGQPERRLDELLALAMSDGLIGVRPDAKDGRKMLYYRVGNK